jgi:ankyrin repeat protein
LNNVPHHVAMKRVAKVHPHTYAQKHANKTTQQALVAAMTRDVAESDKSSELEAEEKEEMDQDSNALIAKTIAEGGLAAKKGSMAFLRTELKKKIVREVLAEVLPDIGAYDLNGTVQSMGNKRKGQFHQMLKFFGLAKLTLHDLIMTGNFNAVEKYLVEINEGRMPNPMLVNQADEQNRIPLIMAAKLKNTKLVRLMLYYKATPDITEESTGRTALYYSVMHGTHAMTDFLLQRHASVNLADHMCVTPLMLALLNNDVTHTEALCNKLAEVDAQVGVAHILRMWVVLLLRVCLCNAGLERLDATALRCILECSGMHQSTLGVGGT